MKITTIPNLSILHTCIESTLETTNAHVFWKDKKGAYLGVNQQFLKVSDFQSFDDVVGNKDTDFIWAEQAPMMMLHDQEVISTGHSNFYLEAAKSPNHDIIQYFNYKTPLKSRNGKIIGVFGISVPVMDSDSMANAVNETAMLINKQLNKTKIGPQLLLSKQQKYCLYYLVKGMTYKQIAAKLQLSSKTVEHYLNRVKIKMNCKSRSELVEKALQLEEIKYELLK